MELNIFKTVLKRCVCVRVCMCRWELRVRVDVSKYDKVFFLKGNIIYGEIAKQYSSTIVRYIFSHYNISKIRIGVTIEGLLLFQFVKLSLSYSCHCFHVHDTLLCNQDYINIKLRAGSYGFEEEPSHGTGALSQKIKLPNALHNRE